MNRIRRAIAVTALERYLVLGINFAMLVVVSRTLTPTEIGISVMGLAVVGIGIAMREFSTPTFLIPEKTLSADVVRATFTSSLLLSGLIAAGLNVLAGPIAYLYAQPGLGPLLRVFSIGIVLEAVSNVVITLLRRDLRLGLVAVLNLCNAAVNAAVTIAFVAMGFSFMSFAYGGLAATSATMCVALFIWRDWSVFRPSIRNWKGTVVFGAYNGVNVFMYRLYESAPYIVLGRFLSIDALAIYNRSVAVCQIPEKATFGNMSATLIPVFSEELRKGNGLRESYLKSIELLTGLHWPMLVGLCIFADAAVMIVLGDQWHDAVPIVRIMAIALLASFSCELNYPVLVSLGAMRDLMVRSAIVWPVSALVITAGAAFGLKYAALAWLLAVPFQAYVSISAVMRHVDMTWADVFGALRKSAVVTLLSALGPLLVSVEMAGSAESSSIVMLATGIALSALGWFAGLRMTGHPLLTEVQQIAGLVRARLARLGRKPAISHMES